MNEERILLVVLIEYFAALQGTAMVTVFIFIVASFLKDEGELHRCRDQHGMLTFAWAFSSAVITVRTGMLVSLSDKQSGSGLHRRCR